MLTWILDNGHGGMVGAEYMTKGKRSPVVKPGLGVYEGEFNRDIVKRVCGAAPWEGLQVIDLVPEAINIGLKERRDRIRKVKKTFGECALISIHANAAGDGVKWHRASGERVFTRKPPKVRGSLKHDMYIESESLADSFAQMRCYKTTLKQANFAIIMEPIPSILIEAPFMTNKEDAEKLASDSFRKEFADTVVATMSYFAPTYFA